MEDLWLQEKDSFPLKKFECKKVVGLEHLDLSCRLVVEHQELSLIPL